MTLHWIKEEAHKLGFFACGAAEAKPVDADVAAHFKAWVAQEKQADMHYMGNYLEKRLDPCRLVPGTKTILSLAMNYAPAQLMSEEEYRLAAYAYGKDYHDLMKSRLRILASLIQAEFEALDKQTEAISSSFTDDKDSDDTPPSRIAVFVDTAPVLERYWAQKAGIGWIGRNHQLIIPRAGSMFFLGEIFLPFALDTYDTPMSNRCGKCRRCIAACPVGAIGTSPYFESHKCLSYQLIENRNALSSEAIETMGNMIYGCDRCQTACPWNQFATPTNEPDLQPRPDLLAMKKADWHNLSIEHYRELFRGSAVKRAKYDGLMRNIHAAELAQMGKFDKEETKNTKEEANAAINIVR